MDGGGLGQGQARGVEPGGEAGLVGELVDGGEVAPRRDGVDERRLARGVEQVGHGAAGAERVDEDRGAPRRVEVAREEAPCAVGRELVQEQGAHEASHGVEGRDGRSAGGALGAAKVALHAAALAGAPGGYFGGGAGKGCRHGRGPPPGR